MEPSLRHHINVHLKNPQNNYIILENCKHCKLDRRLSYGSNFKKPKNYSNQQILPITFNSLHRLANFHVPSTLPTYNPIITNDNDNIDYESDSSSTIYGFPDYLEENKTSLELVNSNTYLSIYLRGINKIEKCAICCESLKSFQIVRNISCGHKFHQNCVDKWLENKNTCPMCRFSFSE